MIFLGAGLLFIGFPEFYGQCVNVNTLKTQNQIICQHIGCMTHHLGDFVRKQSVTTPISEGSVEAEK